ncbi:MAG TPA: GYF domain-containing protein [Hyalangium sp.]|nr:GYF domain-containing protein [Hyalangium sp.]
MGEDASNGPTATPPPVFGGISEAELDEIVSQLRTDKNLTVAPVPAASERLGAMTAQLLLSTPGTLGLFESDMARDEAARQSWYISLNDRVTGPLPVAALRGHWERGELSPDSLCWRKGFEDWRRVCQVPGLAEFLAPRPATAPSTPDELVPDPRAGALDFPLKGAEGLRILAADLPPPLPHKAPDSLPPVLEPEPATAPMLEPEPPTLPEAPQAQDAAGAHPVLSAPTQVEVRVRGGVWLALGGGLVGGMLVALVMWLLGLSAALGVSLRGTSGQDAASTGTAAASASAAPSAPANTAAPHAPAPAIPADTARVSAQSADSARAPSLGQNSVRVPAIGAVPRLGNAATAVTSPRAPAPLPRATPPPSETVQAPASVAAPVRKVQQDPSMQKLAKMEVSAQSESSAGKSVAAPAAKANEEDDEDLGLDEEFERELNDPTKRAAPAKRTVWIPPDPKSPEPTASLSQSDIFSVVVANKGDIAACVSAQKLQAGEGARKVALRWSILPSGKVTEVVTETAEYRGTPLALCLEGKVRAWTFPKHREQGSPVRFPFVF